MQNILTIIMVVIAVLLMATILLQQRGASLGGAFGGNSGVYRSRRGVEKLLYHLTIILAIIFIALSITLLIV